MAHFRTLVTRTWSLLLILALTGCNSTRWNWLHPEQNNKPPVAAGSPANVTVASLVDYLNENAGRVRSLDVERLDITCSVGIQSFGLTGRLQTEKPRNFRMTAKVLGSDAADLGSNRDEFWFWIAKNQPPYQFYCPYKDLAEARNLPIPFQPDWVMETLGLGPYGPADRYQPLEQQGDTVRLVERTRSPQGAAVRKVIVMRGREVRPPLPQVTAYLLIDDATGKEICSAHVHQTQIDRATGAILPRRLELQWPAERLTLSMILDGVETNKQLQPQAFLRPRLNGVESFNLARRQLDSGLQPAQGFTLPR
jgi:hypothetical protein